jgi:hypothetical protein
MGKRERRRRREAAVLAGSPLVAMRALGRTELLRQLVSRRQELDWAIVEEVDRLSGAGVGWGDIGTALGVSRQAARQAAIRRRREPPRQPALSPYRRETSV